MKFENLVIVLLVAAAFASCDKKPGKADNAASPTPTVTVKASGTVNQAADDVPKPPVESSPTPPK